jgi:hypothetical protein
MDDARTTRRSSRLLCWSLAGAAAFALGGCLERHEPANPFIGPFGASDSEPFAAVPGAPAGDGGPLAVRQAR